MSDISNVFYLHLGQITPRRAKLARSRAANNTAKKTASVVNFFEVRYNTKKSGLPREQVLKKRLLNALQEREHLTQCINTSDQPVALKHGLQWAFEDLDGLIARTERALLVEFL